MKVWFSDKVFQYIFGLSVLVNHKIKRCGQNSKILEVIQLINI